MLANRAWFGHRIEMRIATFTCTKISVKRKSLVVRRRRRHKNTAQDEFLLRFGRNVRPDGHQKTSARLTHPLPPNAFAVVTLVLRSRSMQCCSWTGARRWQWQWPAPSSRSGSHGVRKREKNKLYTYTTHIHTSRLGIRYEAEYGGHKRP